MQTINQYALHVAQYIQNKRPELCWQACMHMAWRLAHCKYAMREGCVAFSFIKLNGQIRDAEGTTKLDLVPKDKQPKGLVPQKDQYATVAFFDLDKSEWRSFRTDFFIDVA